MNGNLSDLSPIVVDIETAPLPNVRDFLEPPDLSDISAPSNYVKPEAISGYIEREKAKRLADYERDCTSKAALDFNLARIVALGVWTEPHGAYTAVCKTEQDERIALRLFWEQARQRQIVGYYIRNFDLPMLIQRSRYLDVKAPALDLGRYARNASVLDLFDVLTFNDMRADSLMPRTVHAFCKRFGIPVTDPIKGSEIPALVAAGEWDKVQSHCASDVALEVALGKQIGAIYSAEMAVAL